MTSKIITGANKGIGFETARQLGALGMTVLVGARDVERGRDAERALRDGGADAHAVQLDVTDATSVQRAAERIEADYGRLDVLVNSRHRDRRAPGPPAERDLPRRHARGLRDQRLRRGRCDQRHAAAAAPRPRAS
jgi:NAD(P)-dependent dehydrogenase (short-subunit alcohol dehydrogenase family)